MPRLYDIVKLNDRFGDYTLLVTCNRCKHTRRSDPHLFARIFGWETTLVALVARLRCSTCDAKDCTIVAESIPTPRGIPKNPH